MASLTADPHPSAHDDRVVLVCGPAGSGKSTHAQHLAAQGYELLSFDEEAWRRGHHRHPVPDDVAREVHADLHARLVAALARGDRVVVDTSFWSRASRDRYRELLAPLGVRPVVHHVRTPRDVALARLARRRGTGPDDVAVPPDLAAAYQDGFEAPTPDEGPLRVVPGT